MILVSIYIILSIIKTSETSPNNTLEEKENDIRNGHLNFTNPLALSNETDQSTMKPPITSVLISPPSPVNFDQELAKLKGFAKFIDPKGNKLLNPDDFKGELKKIEDLTRLINRSETKIFSHREIKKELTGLEKFIKFINRNDSESVDPSIVENEIEKLIEIGKFVNQDKPLGLSPSDVKQFLDKLENFLKIFNQSENKILNFENCFVILERVTELYSIIDLKDNQNFNFNDNNPLFDLFKKFTKEKNDFCLEVFNTEKFEENLQVEFTKFITEKKSEQTENSFDPKQILEKLKHLANFLKLCDIKTINTEEFEKVLNKELDRLKKISQFMDLNNAQSLNIDSFGEKLEKYMKFAELLDKADPPILDYEKVDCELLRLQEFSKIINPSETISFKPDQVEEQLEKFHKLSQIIDQKGLQDIKIDEITNELERLNELAITCDLNEHETLTFDQIEQKLNEISDLAKVINPEQQHSIKLEEIEGKLKNHIESANLITTQQTLISDGNKAEKEEFLKTLEQIQNDSPSTVINEDFQKEIKETELKKSYSEIPVQDFQSESAEIGRVIEPYISENLENTKFEYTIPVNYQGDDPNVYTFSDVGTSQVFIQPGDFKKNIEKFQELVKTIKSEIETYTAGNLKNELPEEILKLIDLREIETLNPVDFENKIEMLYNFAESLKNRSSSAEDRAQKTEKLDWFIDKNVTITSNYEDVKLEKEVHRAKNNINKKSGKNRLANSEIGQNKKKSLTQTKSSTKSEDKRIKSSSKSQKSPQVIKKNAKDGSITKLFDEFSHDQDKKSKMSNKKLQSITNVPVMNDLENDEIEGSDQPYGDDPNVYNSVEIAPNLTKNTTDVSLNENEQFRSSELESVFYNPKKLLSAENHENFEEKNVFSKSQANKLKVFGEKSTLRSQKDSENHKNIRKVEVGELKPNIILHFTFIRSL